jgi:4'-phosphopantetheinyl transferase
MTLHPIIMPVAAPGYGLSGKEKVARLSRLSREALRLSAAKSALIPGELRKDEDDVPCPSNGCYWSVSHKSKWVAAVVSRSSIGIDIEEIRPRSGLVFEVVATDAEWSLSHERTWHTFFRYWTAKEATLKAVGIGIGGLRKCRVISIPDENHVLLNYRNNLFRVGQLLHRNHIVSVLQNDDEIEWGMIEDSRHS